MTDIKNNESTGGYVPGELVDVTIRGCRVATDETDAVPGWIYVDVDSDWRMLVDVRRATVTRVAPPEWPPQPADIWRDRNKVAWAALRNSVNGQIEMGCTHDARSLWANADELLAEVGPMRLEYRHGWTPQADPAPAEPGEVDERTNVVLSLRSLANYIEANPDIPTPYAPGAQCDADSMEHFRELVDRHSATIHVDDDAKAWARLEFGKAGLTIYHRKPQPPAPAVDEPTALLPVVPLPGVGAQPVDDPVTEPDDRCRSTHPGEFAPGQHYCELYGAHPAVKHICICGTEWPNANAGSYDPVTGLTGGGAIFDDVPAPRDAAE